MAKVKEVYVCSNCGNQSPKAMGKCHNCNTWYSYEKKTIETRSSSQRSGSSSRNTSPAQLKNISTTSSDRAVTGIGEFDRVMGGGIVKDSITILSAPPGIGKSTLTLKICNEMASKGYKVLYASGEESDSQIKSRADRTVEQVSENFWVYSETSMDAVLRAVEELDSDFIVIDSIQTFTLEEYNPSRTGSPTQVVECASALKDICKNGSRPRFSMVICQMNKDEEMAGPRTLEHLVDTVLYLEGESGEELRHLIPKKNRFGDTSESGLWAMLSEGMVEIKDPSEFFMTRRTQPEAGSALAVIRDGTRTIAVEIESLVSSSSAPFPSRTALCFGRKEQLSTLVSIMEQRAGISLYDKNVIVQTTGGLKLSETSVNLAVIMSIASSVYKKGIPTDTVFIGELGLTGELKKVPAIEQRLKDLDRMGFKKAYVPAGTVRDSSKFKSLEVIECKRILDVINKQFQ